MSGFTQLRSFGLDQLVKWAVDNFNNPDERTVFLAREDAVSARAPGGFANEWLMTGINSIWRPGDATRRKEGKKEGRKRQSAESSRRLRPTN